MLYARTQVGGFYPLHASAFHEEDCVGCARLLLGAGARLDVHWVRHALEPTRLLHSSEKLPQSMPMLERAGTPGLVSQFTMTPYDYAVYRNRTGLAGVLEAEANRQGITNYSTSLEPQ